MSTANCRYCGVDGAWTWSYYSKKPMFFTKENTRTLVHRCHVRDIFPGWCLECQKSDLSFVRRGEYEFQLMENYGLPHTCTENGETEIEEISEAKCKHCSTSGLFWIYTRRSERFLLVEATGNRHKCKEYDSYMKDWSEAKRIDYAFEKAWIKSKADDLKCKKCHGRGHRIVDSRNKRLMQKYGSSEPIRLHKPCRHCKRIGTYSSQNKKAYLKALRTKYWPFRPGVHKWNRKYDY